MPSNPGSTEEFGGHDIEYEIIEVTDPYGNPERNRLTYEDGELIMREAWYTGTDGVYSTFVQHIDTLTPKDL